jgi:type I restriction enzyme M protein
MSKDNAAHKAILERQLWASADVLRGHMSSSEYQHYLLGTIFYKYLSEQTERKVEYYLINDPGYTFESVWEDEELREDVADHLRGSLGYVIPPEYLYSTFLKEIEKGTKGNWSVDLLQTAFNSLEASTVGQQSHQDFAGLFSNVNLTSPNLGKDIPTRSLLMGQVLQAIGKIDFHLDDAEIDVLGDAYEYLISQFASDAGKKGGEFYTPQSVSTILSRIVNSGEHEVKKLYDPTCGSGSLLLRSYREATHEDPEVAKELRLYGQELNTTTYNLARMNMILHGVNWANFSIKNGNTLTEDQFPDMTFDAIVANPPYSAQWKPNEQTLKDPRYAPYSKTAPASKADFAFVQHIIHHLSDTGIAGVVLPHGVLFRGAAEGVIRKKIIENNHLDAVIGLPANIFYGTSIPTCILVFRKDREADDKVLFIDASNEFDKGKNQNSLSPDHIKRIVDTYTEREELDKYSALVSREDIKKNDYNLNIPRYVDSSEEEEPVDLDAVAAELWKLGEQEAELQRKIDGMISQLRTAE